MNTSVDKENIERIDTPREIIYKEKDWNEYVEYKKEKFEELSTQNNMDSSIIIRRSENEFHKLTTILKDKYGNRFADFLIVDTGLSRFYYLCKSSGLFDIMKAIKLMNERFRSEYLKNCKIEIVFSISDKNMSNGTFTLHMSDQVRSIIEELSRDINVNQSSLGLIFCILTFNRAKKNFEEIITDNFEIYYNDNGYYRFIKNEINDAARKGILLLANLLPEVLEDIRNDESIIKYHKEHGEEIDQKFKDRLIYKLAAADEVISVIVRNSALLPTSISLDGIIDTKNKLEIISF